MNDSHSNDENKNLEKELHISRYIIFYKFVLGLLELLLGLGIIIFGSQVVKLYKNFKSQELLEDPHDLLVNLIEKSSSFLPKHRGYVVLVLVVLGLVKVVGAVGLIYHKHWGLDLLVILTISILPFQVYNLISSFSFPKLIFLFINIFIALYLVKFQPRSYLSHLKSRVRPKNKDSRF